MEVKREVGVGGPSSSRLTKKRTREVEKKFPCSEPGCDKSFHNTSNLKRHKGDCHGPKEVCNDCGYTFVKSSFQTHLKKCKKVVDKDEDESDSDSENEIEIELDVIEK